MPRVHEPTIPTAGPGSAFASARIGGKARRRRRKKQNSVTRNKGANGSTTSDNLIGQDLLDWTEEDEKGLGAELGEKPTTPPVMDAKKGVISSRKVSAASLQTDQPVPCNTTTPTPTLKPRPPGESGCPPRASHVRHALMIDTRMLDTESGRQVANEFLRETRFCLARLATRGAPPFLVVSSRLEQSKTPKRNGRITVKAVRQYETKKLGDVVASVPVKPPLNAGNTQNKGAIKVPTRLLANTSWKLFGELVDAIAEEERASSAKSPIDAVLVTTEVALFGDSRGESHKQALNRFWRTVRTDFQSTALRSIEIIVLDTGSLRVAKEIAGSAASQDGKVTEETDATDPTLSTMKCVRVLQEHMKKRSELDLKRDAAGNPVVLTISLAKKRGSLDALCRKWLSQLVSRPDARGRISFELPESIDGSQCTVSMDVRYKILPFRADSAASAGILDDLALLARARLEVVQLVPCSCIDSSLVFGLPMAVKPGFENNIAQYQEMKNLVHFLLQHLSRHDLALLLRSHDVITRSDARPLYHTNNQSFLLIAEELPGKELLSAKEDGSLSQNGAKENVRPVEAMLFRYASAEQLLDVGDGGVAAAEGDPETLKQLEEYVETSLEVLESEFSNPLVLDLVRESTSCESDGPARQYKAGAVRTPPSHHLEEVNGQDDVDFASGDAEWTDKSGVGVRANKAAMSDENSSDSISEAETRFVY